MIASGAQVTIGMPIFNNARTLGRAIDTVKAQGFENWHLILSDDRSEDASAELARKASQSDARITFLQNSEREGFMNFAVALQNARTPYFVWLAADDYWHRDFLEKTVGALEAAPAAVSIVPHGAFVGRTQRPIPNLDFLKGQTVARLRQYLRHPGGTRMYGLMRTECARAAFPKRGMNAYDWFFMIALLRQGPQLTLPARLLFRDETTWIRYAEMAMETTQRRVFQRYPVLEMTLALLRNGKAPLRIWPALYALNMRKHEEFLAVNEPLTFLAKLEKFRRRGWPVSCDARKMSELAVWHREHGRTDVAAQFLDQLNPRGPSLKSPAVFASSGALAPKLTMVLTCRNAQNTLGARLADAERHKARVILIDHGSTDRTRQIAEAHRGHVVHDIIDTPYHGYFDLTHQLQQKRDIVDSFGDGWVLHADADEFIDPPKNKTMAQLLSEAESAQKHAISCTEHLYLPLLEDEEHDPDTFQETMRARMIFREHDEKQRLFHSSAPLDLWMATGGHTVTRDASKLANQRVILRHYPGLSLDDLRAQYMSRVFAPDDVRKLWHGPRQASRYYDIVEPDPTLFRAPPSEPQEGVEKRLPIFQVNDQAVSSPCLNLACDLHVICANHVRENVMKHVNAQFPGLRCCISDLPPLPDQRRAVPILHLVTHPGNLHQRGQRRSQERDRAIEWTRHIAQTRQHALDTSAPYIEMRLEDLERHPHRLPRVLRRLYTGRLPLGSAGFLPKDATPLSAPAFANPIRAICGPLAADLGYI